MSKTPIGDAPLVPDRDALPPPAADEITDSTASRARLRMGWLADRAAPLTRIGIDPEDDEELRQKKTLLVLLAILIAPVSVVWGILYLALGSAVGIAPLVYFAISIASLVVFARTRSFHLLLVVQLLDILIAPTAGGQMLVGGFLPSGGVGLWGILAPLGALVFLEVRQAVRWFAAFLFVFVVTGVLGEWFFRDADLPVWFTSTMLALNVVGAGSIAFTVLASFANQRDAALRALRAEQEKAEALLVNVLPSSIAERLKATSQSIADHFESASILFADVVDFTPLARRLAPAEVVGVLDQLFSHFDTLVERHGLEKIKTIGDCYMAASGVPDPRRDHARRAALLALDMQDAVTTSAVAGRLGLELRIGINSGPVVAGVIGTKRFLYDLWGDAVNIASRMEAHGSPGEIQITRDTYELLKDEFVCTPRGTIPVKGKGQMETWYLVGPRSNGAHPERGTDAG
ncbi:MAG TPA: adenylate/guanylate cyclase domain-containing protein [Actinomycetota bacterium]|nr:adenylate/guanylate cyclase domain-containing protein [Actinomycetota bacterium]